MNTRDEEAQPLTGKQQTDVPLVDPTLESRLGFIRKVYSILSIQLVFTALMAFVSINNENIRNFMVQEIWVLILAFIFSLVFMCLLFCCRENARRTPKNYIYLSCFTACFAYAVSAACASVVVQYENGSSIVTMALVMTAAMTVGLTIYACTTKTDLTLCGGLLVSMMICLLIASIFLIFFGSKPLHIIVTIFAVILYSLYLIYDTQLVCGEKRYQLSKDDYILGSLILYIDIVMLFLEILKLLSILFGKNS